MTGGLRRRSPRQDASPCAESYPSGDRTSVRVMDPAWLAERLGRGASIEAIAREAGRHPSTVAYWVNKHGLASTHAAKHASRGGIPREQLAALVEDGLTVRAIAERVGMSYSTVRHWLKKNGLQTRRGSQPRSKDARSELHHCRVHGWVTFVRYGVNDHLRCEQCRKERVVARRRRVKQLLVEEAGGHCCADMTAMPGRCNSIISIRPASRSGSECAESRARSSVAVRRLASAFCYAGTATRRSRPASRPSVLLSRRIALRGSSRSGVAQWQSGALLRRRLWVRVPPPELPRTPAWRGRSPFRRAIRGFRAVCFAAPRIVRLASMDMNDDLALEALEAQGFKAPGPKLIRLVTDALVREEELAGAEARTDPFSFSAIISDTPELLDRAKGPRKDSPAEVSRVLSGVLTEAIRYVLEDEQES
jgi:transposase